MAVDEEMFSCCLELPIRAHVRCFWIPHERYEYVKETKQNKTKRTENSERL